MPQHPSSVEDLAANPRFVAYALGEPAAQAEWTAWLSDHPEQAARAAEAADLVRHLYATQSSLPTETIDQLWDRLQQRLPDQE